MSIETIVAAFDTPKHAQAAVDALKAAGFHANDISVFDKARLDQARLASGNGNQKRDLPGVGLWRSLFGGDIAEHEATVFNQTVQKGGSVISLRVLDTEVAHATGILNIHRPFDVHDRAVTTGVAPAARVEAVAKEAAAMPLAATQRVVTTPKFAAGQKEVLRLAEEQLEVGKELVETGRTRIRRFTTERDVAADVSLHEEHAEVLRRVIIEPAAFKDVDWSDDMIEVVESAEHAIANKTTRYVEEITLKKIGSDHVETVHDRLRRQQIEVVQVDKAGKPIARPSV